MLLRTYSHLPPLTIIRHLLAPVSCAVEADILVRVNLKDFWVVCLCPLSESIVVFSEALNHTQDQAKSGQGQTSLKKQVPLARSRALIHSHVSQQSYLHTRSSTIATLLYLILYGMTHNLGVELQCSDGLSMSAKLPGAFPQTGVSRSEFRNAFKGILNQGFQCPQ